LRYTKIIWVGSNQCGAYPHWKGGDMITRYHNALIVLDNIGRVYRCRVFPDRLDADRVKKRIKQEYPAEYASIDYKKQWKLVERYNLEGRK
jgi:hypothetical protein